MKYISGLHALNIPCRLETTGDWHTLSLSWENIPLWETEDSPFGTQRIELHQSLMGKKGVFYVADHIRACLDMLQAGDFSNLQGMRHDYICTDIYDAAIFAAVWKFRSSAHWPSIDRFMEKEYRMKWVRFRKEKEQNGHGTSASYRSRNIPAHTHHRVDGIEGYNIDRICQLKTGAYQGRDKIRDLYDICFICDQHFDSLSDSAKEQLKAALTYKGFDYFDYVTSTQEDSLIDKNALAELYLKMFEKLDLLYSKEEAESLPTKENGAEKEDDEQEEWSR